METLHVLLESHTNSTWQAAGLREEVGGELRSNRVVRLCLGWLGVALGIMVYGVWCMVCPSGYTMLSHITWPQIALAKG